MQKETAKRHNLNKILQQEVPTTSQLRLYHIFGKRLHIHFSKRCILFNIFMNQNELLNNIYLYLCALFKKAVT